MTADNARPPNEGSDGLPKIHPVPNCFEVSRNGRFCVGAEEAAAKIISLRAQLAETRAERDAARALVDDALALCMVWKNTSRMDEAIQRRDTFMELAIQEAGELSMSQSSVKRVSSQLAEAPREKLVEIIDQQARECDMRADDNLKLCKEIDVLNARILALESHQRWRSVAEGLPPAGESPKYSDEVEIVFRDSNQAHRTIGCYCFMDQSWRDNDDRRLWVPTHWREIGPLPDLPAKAEALAK